MLVDNSFVQILGDLRRLARQRKPAQIADVATSLTRLLAGSRTFAIEERPNGLVIRFAGGGIGINCFIHRPPAVELTNAESAVARELCVGRTLAQIARLRGVSPNTVKSQVRQIFRKLDVDSRIELVRLLGP